LYQGARKIISRTSGLNQAYAGTTTLRARSIPSSTGTVQTQLDLPFYTGRIAHHQHDHAGLVQPLLYLRLPVSPSNEIAIDTMGMHAHPRPSIGFGYLYQWTNGIEG
jgi:hypothetical protein